MSPTRVLIVQTPLFHTCFSCHNFDATFGCTEWNMWRCFSVSWKVSKVAICIQILNSGLKMVQNILKVFKSGLKTKRIKKEVKWGQKRSKTGWVMVLKLKLSGPKMHFKSHPKLFKIVPKLYQKEYKRVQKIITSFNITNFLQISGILVNYRRVEKVALRKMQNCISLCP